MGPVCPSLSCPDAVPDPSLAWDHHTLARWCGCSFVRIPLIGLHGKLFLFWITTSELLSSSLFCCWFRCTTLGHCPTNTLGSGTPASPLLTCHRRVRTWPLGLIVRMGVTNPHLLFCSNHGALSGSWLKADAPPPRCIGWALPGISHPWSSNILPLPQICGSGPRTLVFVVSPSVALAHLRSGGNQPPAASWLTITLAGR